MSEQDDNFAIGFLDTTNIGYVEYLLKEKTAENAELQAKVENQAKTIDDLNLTLATKAYLFEVLEKGYYTLQKTMDDLKTKALEDK